MRNVILLLYGNWFWNFTEYFSGFIIDFVRNFANCWIVMKKERLYIITYKKFAIGRANKEVMPPQLIKKTYIRKSE